MMINKKNYPEFNPHWSLTPAIVIYVLPLLSLLVKNLFENPIA